ncbi:GTP cyclohydrolase I FolE2 [Stetteria hydrogenophila]
MEIQDSPPSVPLPLAWVGFRGLRVRVSLATPEGPMLLNLSVDAEVSLSNAMRGAHLSRNVEALVQALEPRRTYRSIEEYLESAARELLDRHPYAERARASASTTLYADLEYAGIRGVEPFEARISVVASRGGGRLIEVGASVYGMTVCPSAMETASVRLGVLPGGVSISHSQKARLSGVLRYSDGFVRVEEVARALWSAFSAPSFTFLKRTEESRLVEAAHRNPQFAEDVARRAVLNLYRLAKKHGLPSTAEIVVEVDSMESIHPHNVHAQAAFTVEGVESYLRNAAEGEAQALRA